MKELTDAALQAFAKWRNVYAAWLLGRDSKYAARDLYEKVLMLRAEVNALTDALIAAGALDAQRFSSQLAEELDHLDRDYAGIFSGISTSAGAVHVKLPEALHTASRFGFDITDLMWEPHASSSDPINRPQRQEEN